MLTPVFEIKQDGDFVFITVRAPYTRISEAEVFIEDEEFKFYAKPYFLRLHFPGKLIEDGRSNCLYDADNGEFQIKIAKLEAGTHFQDLDMLTKLLSPKGKPVLKQPLIEVVDERSETKPELPQNEEEIDWYFSQTSENQKVDSLVGSGYGFANQKSGIFEKLYDDLADVIQLKNPENSTFEERNKERMEKEIEQFSDDHYLADLFDNEEISDILKSEPPWCEKERDESFTEDEKCILKELPNIEYLLDKSELQSVYLGLVDILFSFSYNWRCTEGEYSVESAWNIRTISQTLAWCDRCSNIQSTILSAYRRSLIFPLYRHWKLAKTCHKDVASILSCGKKYILKCLLDIYKLFRGNDPYYLLNDLYIKDYCIWIQTANSNTIRSLAKAVKKLKIHKEDVGLELVELEQAAKLVLEEENSEKPNICGAYVKAEELTTNDIVNDLEKLQI